MNQSAIGNLGYFLLTQSDPNGMIMLNNNLLNWFREAKKGNDMKRTFKYRTRTICAGFFNEHTIYRC